MDRMFWNANEEEILNGRTTDIYFPRTIDVLNKKGIDARVTMEMWTKSFPDEDYKFGVLSGIEEAVKLLEYVARKQNKPISVYAMREGEIFFPDEPVMRVEGFYKDFGIYENPVLGFVCSASGIATKASRVRIAAGDRQIFSFGTRRVPPAIAPMVERACHTGGFDKFSNVLGAELLGEKPVGTMPHALTLIMGEPGKAFEAFDEVMPDDVPRIALIDTLYSPKEESLIALDVLGKKLSGLRVDSGDLKTIGKELRWECDTRGRKDIKLFASGGLDEYKVKDLSDVYDGFGVGTDIANAPTIDFALKIVEVDGTPRAKVTNKSGAKAVYRKDFQDIVTLKDSKAQEGYEPLLVPYLINGRRVREEENMKDVRSRVLEKLKNMPKELRELRGDYISRVRFEASKQ